MRIARLDLHAFGPFSNAKLSFDYKPKALQLVYGLNEAGKSTTLRALVALLYGIPARTTDAHVHEMGKLRVGGVLLDEAGGRHEIVRRKGLKNTLLSRDDKPIEEVVLKRLLGGLDETLFRQMFGLDHERLRQGAEALLAGGGHVGEGLFDAGTGARAIREALTSLELEADSIFKARGRTTPKLNIAIEALKEHHKAQRDATLSPQAFLEQEAEVSEARKQREIAVGLRRTLREERSRLERAVRQLPLLTSYVTLTTELNAQPHETVSLDETWLSQLHELRARFLSTRKTEAELPRERERAHRLAEDIKGLKTRVLSAGELQHTLDTPTRARLRKLSEGYEARVTEQRQLTRAVDEARASESALREKITTVETPPEALSELVKRVDQEGLEAGLLALEVELAQAQVTLESRASALGVPSEPSVLARLTLPEDQDLLNLEQRTAELQQAIKHLHARRTTLRARVSELAHERERLLADGDLASLGQLSSARSVRDAALSHVRKQLELGAALSLAQVVELEKRIVDADDIADRLQREAQRSVQVSRLDADLRATERDLADLEQEQAEQQRTEAALAATTTEIAAPLGLTGLSQRELRPRVHKLGLLVELAVSQCARVEKKRVLLERAALRISELEAVLLPASGEAALIPNDAGRKDAAHGEHIQHKLAGLSAAARRRVEALAKQEQEQALLQRRLDEIVMQRLSTDEKQASVARELSELSETFRHELVRLGLSPTLSPHETLHTLDELTELERCTRELRQLEGTLTAHAADMQQIRDDVLDLAQRAAPNLCNEDPALETGRLLERLEQDLGVRREARKTRETRSAELANVKQQLLETGDGAALEVLFAQLSELDAPRVRARLTEIAEELEQLDRKIEGLDQAIGGKEATLSVLEKPSNAVTLAEEVQSDLSNVQVLLRRYLELRLSATLLKREVERYRAKHQGPVLSRASQLFPDLTLGRYRGLDAMYDEKDEAVLCAVRHDGQTVRVLGLSDGTRDQLYLALRVASIERFLENNPPLPLILDDAFVHFDDKRAAAALRVLGHLCQKTQVMMFTHHQRIVDLAKQALGRDGVALHELDPVRGVVNLLDDGPLFSGLT